MKPLICDCIFCDNVCSHSGAPAKKMTLTGEKYKKCRPSSSLAALQTPNWCVMPSVKCNRPEFKSRTFIPSDTNPGNVSLSVKFPQLYFSHVKSSIQKYSIDQLHNLPGDLLRTQEFHQHLKQSISPLNFPFTFL